MPTNNALTLDCIMRIMRAEIPHAYFNSPAAGERFARAIESEVLAPTQKPNYCDIHCKKFCQNSVHGMCDGPPAQQPSGEVTHGNTTMDECMASLLDRLEVAEMYADRYRYLRERPLDAVSSGGVFAGKTPDNVVLNGADLDAAIDAARAEGGES